MALEKHSRDIENNKLPPSSQSPSAILHWTRRLVFEAFLILLSLIGIPLFVSLAFASVCIVFLALFQIHFAFRLDDIYGLAILLAMAPVLLFCQVCFHEFGHLTMASLVRYELHLMKLGPFLVIFAGRRMSLGFHWSLKPAVGYVVASPNDISSWRLRQMIFILGGPATNLAAGIACLIAASALNQPAGLDSSRLISSIETALTAPASLGVVLFNVAGLLGLNLACANLVPYQFGTLDTDGMLLLKLLSRDNLKRDAQLRLLKKTLHLSLLGTSMSKGTRPRNWESIQVKRLQDSLTGDSTDAQGNLYCYYHYLDCGQIEQAGQYLERALTHYAGYPVISRNSLFLEGAYFEARFGSNVAAAFGWLAESKEGNAEEQTHCRAEAALLWARGRFAEAASRAEAGLKAIPHSRDLGGRLAEKEWLEELLQACQKSIGELNTSAR